MTTFKDAIREVFPQAKFSDEGSSTDTAERISRAYTTIVEALGQSPIARLATLGRSVWDVVHHRHVHTALYDDVTVITFAIVARRNSPPQGVILIPRRWLDLLSKEPLMGIGSVIYTGSQAVDHYNDRSTIDSLQMIYARSYSYEAEFLKACRDLLLPLNQYQQGILRDYPQGFDAEKYGYDYRPVAPECS